MTSSEMRERQSFLRNEFLCVGKYDIPIIRRECPLDNIELISYNDTSCNEKIVNRSKGVHFFIDDYRLNSLYNNYEKTSQKLKRYRFVLTPDYSLYIDLPRAIQINNVFRNRWCGAYWQSQGIKVIPSISWADISSFDFCFDGVEQSGIVAVSTIGCRKKELKFMRGYDKMLEKLNPTQIICFGKPFEGMDGNIVAIDYISSRRLYRNGR